MTRSNSANRGFDTYKLVGLGLLTAIVVVLQFIGASIRFGTFSISLVLMPIVVGAALYGIGAGAWLGLVFGVVVLLSGDANTFLTINPFGTVVTVLAKGILAGTVSGLVYKLLSGHETTGRLSLAIASLLMLGAGAFCIIFGEKQNAGTLPTDVMAAVRSAEAANPHPGTPFIVIGIILAVAGAALLAYDLIKKPTLNVSAAVFVSAAICPIVNTGIFLLGCKLFFMDTIREWAGGTNVGTFMIVGLVGFNFILELAINLILSPAIVMLIRIGEKSIAKK
ncbi:MAG: energy-coupled thiamine transporter ThiT [Clostridia bacterium]|nr:energy-coupled thiamine transporter ThiT [Clostridia bacterium]